MEEKLNTQIENKYNILLDKDFISINNMEQKELLQKLHVNNFFLIIINYFIDFIKFFIYYFKYPSSISEYNSISF